MRKNRDRLSIIASVLGAAGYGTCKTRIMLNANLSFKLINKYLDLVLSLDMIHVERQIYSLTDKGQSFLKQYHYIRERYDIAKENLESLDYEYENLSRLCERRPLDFSKLRT